jgi:Lectin C-type domain
MSSVSRGSGARSCVPLAIALLACSGSGGRDLFEPSTSTGTCTTNCGPGATTTSAGAGGAPGSSATSSTSGGAAGAATTTATTTATTGSGSGGAGGSPSTTSGGAGTTGGGTSAGGTTGAGTGGSPVDDAGVTPTEDAHSVDVVSVVDSGTGTDAVVGRDACVPTGNEVCDGIDNNCNGNVDENACRSGCVGATYGGIGYMLCFGQNQERIWTDAVADCKNHDMHLVRVDDAMQNAFIRKTSLSVNYSDSIWIGASDSAREGTWIWLDGAQFWQGGVAGHTVDGRYAGWDMDQPNSADGPEDCAVIWSGIETWHDVNCLIRHAYMCQALAPLR